MLCTDVIYLEKIDQADPIDRALIFYAIKNSVDIDEIKKYKRIYDKPFDSQNRYMACGFEVDGERIYFTKGDPDIIIKKCNNYISSKGVTKKVNSEFISRINNKVKSITQDSDITLALAYNLNPIDEPPSHYTFICLLQLENPMKPSAPITIKNLNALGLRSVLLTGDRLNVAIRVGKKVGLTKDISASLTGTHISQMDLDEVARQSDYISIFSRLLPSQKGILVRLLKERNKWVAMVGDGVNDVIALKVADVGISFTENSSHLAKGVSEVLINDLDDILSLIKAARRITLRLKYLKTLRVILLISLLLSLYWYILFN